MSTAKHISLNEQLLAISSISGWIGCNWSGGSFGERVFFTLSICRLQGTILGSYKCLVAPELLVNEMRQRECNQRKDKILAPLAFAMKIATTNERALRQDIDAILDYRLNTEEHYYRFTKLMIKSMII
ncbi:hypothetical protein BU25DRAFT_131950 [Macroventuria anomochaeta]|uniref:Uncharacterized protein n=1 Tax=Macroventuria anomochaeta TaxID=301207 RepID=A0ACB6RRT4_9PLEO|nr:uncharacterized protein BU25DRAFT_131950 [Macroventuria anomochaeta]KAF2624675.1 hypothetical protein BU25DRAFT_131950 [Macroventuria anomochaeta]